MKHVFKNEELIDARENSGKNRNPTVVPADVNRVRLMTVVPDRNDYINAVFLHVSYKQNGCMYGVSADQFVIVNKSTKLQINCSPRLIIRIQPPDPRRPFSWQTDF